MADPKPSGAWWQTRLRVSIRGLMVLVLILGVGQALVIHQAQVQRDSVIAIRQAHGEAFYGWDFKGDWLLRDIGPRGKPWVPEWLVDWLGVDYFGHVVDVRFRGSVEVTDAVMVAVGRLPRLERLTLSVSGMTDAGMTNLRGLTGCRSSTSEEPKSATACSRTLREWQGSSISMSAGPGSPTLVFALGRPDRALLAGAPKHQNHGLGVGTLEGLDELGGLDLSSTGVTGSGLIHLKALTGLQNLNLSDTKVAGAGLATSRG